MTATPQRQPQPQPRRRSLALHIGLKRLVDTAVILASVPLTLPATAATALLVRLNMGRPVFFVQERVGLDGRSFQLLKFRSMLAENDADGNLLPSGARLTTFGRILRASSMDELPQLINVLKGDMALVGPRPLLPEYLPFYRAEEQARHYVRPGITGAAQVNGRNNLDWETRLRYDVEYVATVSPQTDLKILAKTALRVLGRNDTVTDSWDHFEDFDIYRSYPTNGALALRRVEPRDQATVTQWQTTSTSAELMPGIDRAVDFVDWLQGTRGDDQRRDLVVYETGTRAIVACTGWVLQPGTGVPQIYLSAAPVGDSESTATTALALVLELLRREHEAPEIRLLRPSSHLLQAARRHGFVDGRAGGELILDDDAAVANQSLSE